MLSYIKSHDFQSFSEKLEQSKPLKPDELACWLTESVNHGLVKFVELLLRNGANPDEICKSSLWNPIHLAIEHGYLPILDILIRSGADLEHRDESGFTPLHHAVDMEADGAYQLDKESIPEFSKQLLDAGADPMAKDFSGTTVVELARQYEYQAFLDLIQFPA